MTINVETGENEECRPVFITGEFENGTIMEEASYMPENKEKYNKK
jgi:hypothetical protein